MILGAHLSAANGLHRAAKTAHEIGADTFQFFSRNPRGSSKRSHTEQETAAFRAARDAYHIGPVLAHAPYTLNPAAIRQETAEFSCAVLCEDVARMDALGIELFNLHPGTRADGDLEAGFSQVAAMLDRACSGDERIVVLLETMSGRGNELGGQFFHLQEILSRAQHREKLGVCMDLCHVYAAGYDLVNRLDLVLTEFDAVIGLERLRAVHLNDSMFPLGSRKDRHMPLGKGCIGLEAILRILSHAALFHLPFYLETPLDDAGHAAELRAINEALGAL